MKKTNRKWRTEMVVQTDEGYLAQFRYDSVHNVFNILLTQDAKPPKWVTLTDKQLYVLVRKYMEKGYR